jgi:hypothetical protein
VSALENVIYLTSNPDQDVTLGVPFLAGWLSYTNGTWFTDPVFEIDAVTQSSDDPTFDGFVFADTLQLTITPNTGTPHQNADFLHLVNNPFAGSVRAFELSDSPTGGNSVTAELWMTIDSLHLDGFRNGTGDGFLDPSIELAPTVPELGTVACLGIGLALLAGLEEAAPPRGEARPSRCDAVHSARPGGRETFPARGVPMARDHLILIAVVASALLLAALDLARIERSAEAIVAPASLLRPADLLPAAAPGPPSRPS